MNWLLAEQLSQWASFVTAAASAWLWNKASRVPLPPITYGALAEDGAFVVALKTQSRYNAYAARGASFAALFQGIAILIGLTR
jgi:hypothetical protein